LRNRWAIGILLGALVLFLDFFVKNWVVAHLLPIRGGLYPYGGIGILQSMNGFQIALVHATNTGAAWGLFSDFQMPLLILRIVLVFALLGYLIFFNKNKSIVIPLLLVVSGAFANILDYFRFSHVVDSFKIVFWGYHYPVFNVADSAITIGIIWLFIYALVDRKKTA